MRLRHLLCLIAGLASLAGAVQAQTVTPLTIKDGNGNSQPLCEFKPDGTNYAGCTVRYSWNGSAWVLAPADASGRPAISAPDGALATMGSEGDLAWSSGNGTVIALLKALIAATQGPLAAGTNSIGAISNTGFGITGNLPPFGSTPTFNLGTLNGAATASNQTSVQSAAGTSAGTLITVQGSASGVPIPVAGPCTQIQAVNISTSSGAVTTDSGYTPTAKMHICALVLDTSAAQAVSVIEGGGAGCATSPRAVYGALTADTTHGLQLFAGQGINNTSGTPFTQTQVAGDHLCFVTNGAGTANVLSGTISFQDY